MPLLRRGADCGVANAIWKGRRMTDFEKQVDDAIATWYHSSQYEGDYFDNRRWDELYDEQKQIAAQLFFKEKLS
jgi:hypothetical protein